MCFTLRYLKWIVLGVFTYLSITLCVPVAFLPRRVGARLRPGPALLLTASVSYAHSPSHWQYKSSGGKLGELEPMKLCCWEQPWFPEKWLAEGMWRFWERGSWYFSGVYVQAYLFLRRQRRGRGEEKEEEKTALTPFPPRRPRGASEEGDRRRDVPVRGELASQGKLTACSELNCVYSVCMIIPGYSFPVKVWW